MKDLLFRGAALAVLRTPLHRLIGRRRHAASYNGLFALDRQLATVLEGQQLLRLPALETMTPARARAFAQEGMSPLDVAPIAMAEIIDTTVAGPAGAIPVRIYVPADAGPDWIIYFHGGGGVIGSVRASEPVTRLLAAQTRCVVASVEYRLGPEHRHPAAIDDACAAYDALCARAKGKLVVAGDSFGGFLAAHVERHARMTSARRPDLQVLIYPIVDLTLTSPTIEQLADGYLLTKSMIHWFRDNYLHPTDDQIAPSPLHWDVAGASPAFIVTAGYDPLVGEGWDYMKKLQDAGVDALGMSFSTLIHGFISLAGGITAARDAFDDICKHICKRLAETPSQTG